MRIAVLGWGSLIWDPRELHVASGWQEGGPVLPIEFSRISDNDRLTLVIDEAHGVDVPTRHALSSLSDLDAAVTDLQKREGAPNRDRIGFLEVTRNRLSKRARAMHPVACERICAWAEAKNLDGVVWTAIGPRFREKTGEPFSVEAAIRYLDRVDKVTFARTLHYVWNAPPEVQTPVRTAVEKRWPEG